MHLNLTKHGRFYKQNDQLPTKSHDELKDNSNAVRRFFKLMEFEFTNASSIGFEDIVEHG